MSGKVGRLMRVLGRFGGEGPLASGEARWVSQRPRGGHALRDEQALTFRRQSDPPAGWRKLCG